MSSSTTIAPDECPAKICEVGEKGLFLPLGGDWEQEWPNGLRIVLYMLGLGWCFLGVALIADTFMVAIERITSKKARRMNPKSGRFITILLWNPTVANLTLMALGSSAPEILLSCIELFAGDFKSGDLGPSTIVGSAAFNLFCITAVCVAAIPYDDNGVPQIRYIAEMPVYAITATCSVCAYLWLLVILQLFTPDAVTIAEGIITFLFFPVMVGAAFMADKGYFSKNPVKKQVQVTGPDMDPQELAECMLKVRQKHGDDLTDDQVMRIMEVEFGQKSSRAAYRIGATRGIMGNKKKATTDAEPAVGRGSAMLVKCIKDETSDELKAVPAVIGFATARCAVLENVGKARIVVERKGATYLDVKVQYRTKDGSAEAVSDYEPVSGELHFLPDEMEKEIFVGIIDDISHEEDEDFFIELHDAEVCGKGHVRIHEDRGVAKVVIIDDDDPGMLRWESEEVEVLEEVNDIKVNLTVHRVNGCTGTLRCSYKTENGTAVAGPDFEEATGLLEFGNEVMSQQLEITVKANGRFEGEENFRVMLFNGDKDNALFDEDTDGGKKECICTVTVKAHKANQAQIARLMSKMRLNEHQNSIGHENWKDQFKTAIQVNGGDDSEGPPGIFDYFMHVITIPWKLIFAFVPPVDYCDGWICFISSLIMIGVVTALIGDMAALLGCTMGLPDSITAITFVALGTSLPDTFASKSAATQDEHADASIGNVTGSNSVNVFLGLGLPWAIGAIYWVVKGPDAEWLAQYPEQAIDYPDGIFVVKAGNLGFSVIVFSSCAIVCMGLLFIRRLTVGGELGGPNASKYASSAFLVMLWFVYVGLSSWYVFTNSDCL